MTQKRKKMPCSGCGRDASEVPENVLKRWCWNCINDGTYMKSRIEFVHQKTTEKLERETRMIEKQNGNNS